MTCPKSQPSCRDSFFLTAVQLTYSVVFISAAQKMIQLFTRTVILYTYTHTFLCCCSVAKSGPTMRDPLHCSVPGFLVLYSLLELLKLMSVELVMPSNLLILCRSLLLLPPIFPSIRIFSNELTLCIRWPKYWSFIFTLLHMYTFFIHT